MVFSFRKMQKCFCYLIMWRRNKKASHNYFFDGLQLMFSESRQALVLFVFFLAFSSAFFFVFGSFITALAILNADAALGKPQ